MPLHTVKKVREGLYMERIEVDFLDTFFHDDASQVLTRESEAWMDTEGGVMDEFFEPCELCGFLDENGCAKQGRCVLEEEADSFDSPLWSKSVDPDWDH